MSEPRSRLNSDGPHADGSRNPSAWPARLPCLALAAVALCLPTSSGTPSFISHGPDRYLQIALGLVFIIGFFGGSDRWCKHPWFIMILGILNGPILFATALWMIVQMSSNGDWEWIGVVRAGIAILIIFPAIDEFAASLQLLRRRYPSGSENA